MEKENLIINLYRKIISSLTCIEKRTNNDAIKNKATSYLNQYIDYYEKYLNKKEFQILNISDLIDFCNECYDDDDVFDYAEDVEYGAKELFKEINNK